MDVRPLPVGFTHMGEILEILDDLAHPPESLLRFIQQLQDVLAQKIQIVPQNVSVIVLLAPMLAVAVLTFRMNRSTNYSSYYH